MAILHVNVCVFTWTTIPECDSTPENPDISNWSSIWWTDPYCAPYNSTSERGRICSVQWEVVPNPLMCCFLASNYIVKPWPNLKDTTLIFGFEDVGFGQHSLHVQTVGNSLAIRITKILYLQFMQYFIHNILGFHSYPNSSINIPDL